MTRSLLRYLSACSSVCFYLSLPFSLSLSFNRSLSQCQCQGQRADALQSAAAAAAADVAVDCCYATLFRHCVYPASEWLGSLCTVYTTQGIHEGFFARILASLGRPYLSLSLFFSPSFLFFSLLTLRISPSFSPHLSLSLFLSLSLSTVPFLSFSSSSRRPRCISRGSPLDIVAPRRLVRVSLLPCLFFFPSCRLSIARCLFLHQ